MIQFAHVNIITDNWKRLADFYIRVFGYKTLPPERHLEGLWLDKATGIPNARLEGIHLGLPEEKGNHPTLEIFQYEITADNHLPLPNRKGFGHIAFKVDHVLETLDLLIANGGTKVGDIVETEIEGAGTVIFVYARDIDGNIIELQHWKKN
jgi:catechol 2,3-dioxygenase-like lactoylglutathione lyase family enzyme